MKTAHLCIDFQKNYPIDIPDLVPSWGSLKKNISSAIRKFDERGIPTIYVVYGGTPYIPPLENGVDLLKNVPQKTQEILTEYNRNVDLSLRPESLIAFKNGFSAYQGREIATWIDKQGFSKIILSGVFEGAENCIGFFCLRNTAQALRLAKYDVVIAAEATENGVESRNKFFRPLEERRKDFAMFGVDVLPIDELTADLDRDILQYRRHKFSPKSAPTLIP